MPERSPSIRVTPVAIAGGGGTRLWPLSRTGFPKQFLVLTGKESLFQQALRRLCDWSAPDLEVAPPVIVANEEHRFLVLDQLRELGGSLPDGVTLLLEPVGRNTAPALTLAALQAMEGGGDPVLVVTPADQVIADAEAFSRSLQAAARQAASGSVVILGIAADRPETGYGYIRTQGVADAQNLLAVAAFVEKPDPATAQRYVDEGGYCWNSGMFVLTASVWLALLERFRPDILAAVRSAWQLRQTDAQFVRPDAKAFEAVPSDSIDYAVMERCPGAGVDLRMLPLQSGWNDLGAWQAVWQVAEQDAVGNAPSGDVLLHDCRNSLVHATSRLVGAVGLQDVVVVETPDAVLVADRKRSQDVKQIVAALMASDRGEARLPRRVHRPWGWYDSVDAGPRFQVKRICVKPGAKLSLQMHHHRAEHWIVVSGTAEVTCGERTLLLTENQSTYIPLGTSHRLANPGKLPLELIEVQSGSYLGEDDIVRFEDTYGRVSGGGAGSGGSGGSGSEGGDKPAGQSS